MYSSVEHCFADLCRSSLIPDHVSWESMNDQFDPGKAVVASISNGLGNRVSEYSCIRIVCIGYSNIRTSRRWLLVASDVCDD